MFKRISIALLVVALASISFGQAFIWTDIDLEKRSEQGNALSAVQHDNNMTKIETGVNSVGQAMESISTLGEIYQVNNAVATTIPVSDTWVKVENFSVGESEGTTFTANGLQLPAGIWYTTAHMSFSGTSGNIIQFAFGLDGVVDNTHIVERKLSSGDVGASALVAYITATANQVLNLFVKNTAASADVTVKHATVISNRVVE